MLRRALACQETDSDLCAQPLPPDVSQVSLTAIDNFRIVYQANRALELHGWLAGKPAAPWTLPAGQQLSALLRPWRAADAALRWQDDVRTAAQPRPSSQAAIVVTADFLGLAASELDRCLSQASQAGVAVLVCPERIVFLDDEARRRWELGRHVRT
jgi:hypothetical protein